MRIKSVLIVSNDSYRYEVGKKVDGVIIDDILRDTATNDIFMYDELSNLLVRISSNVPTVIEYSVAKTS